MSETKKIGIACFIGGAVCVSIALLVNPMFWWVGLIAGFAAGYLSYEFKEVLIAIKNAAVLVGLCAVLSPLVVYFVIKNWLQRPHPVLCFSGLISFWIIGDLVFFSWETIFKATNAELFFHYSFVGLIWLVLTVSFALIINYFIKKGHKHEKTYWLGFFDEHEEVHKRKFEKLHKKGYRAIPLNYDNFAKIFLQGLWEVISSGCLAIFKKITGFITGIIKFFWSIFVQIHSQQRVLCGIDSALGGSFAFIYAWHTGLELTLSSHIMLIVFGGLIGAAFGILNWELISVRLLKVQKIPIDDR